MATAGVMANNKSELKPNNDGQQSMFSHNEKEIRIRISNSSDSADLKVRGLQASIEADANDT